LAFDRVENQTEDFDLRWYRTSSAARATRAEVHAARTTKPPFDVRDKLATVGRHDGAVVHNQVIVLRRQLPSTTKLSVGSRTTRLISRSVAARK